VLATFIEAPRLRRDEGCEDLPVREALWRFDSMERQPSWQIRHFVAEARLPRFFLRDVDDRQLRDIIRQAIRDGHLIALRKGDGAAEAPSEAVERRRLVRQIEQQTRGRLSYAGRQYKLVVDVDLVGTPSRDSYEVVRQDDAHRVLDGLAKQSGPAGDLAGLLGQASAKLTPDWRPPFQPDGLILLRRSIVHAASKPDDGPAITPSQLRELLEKANLEIHVVDLNQTPQEGLAFKIATPDGGSVSGKLDKEGRGRAKSSTPGIFTVTFPELDGADWDGDGALDLPEEPRSEAGRCKATAEDRVPAIAAAKGFVHWRTVWDFVGNADLRATRENPNVLRDGDEVAIPSKVQRVAEVEGGVAEYVVSREDERIVTFRLLDCEHEPFAGLRYQSKTGDANINRGVVPEDGWVTLAIPSDAKKVDVALRLSNDEDDDPLELEYQVQEEALGDSPEHKNQRLLNLGFTAELPEGEPGAESGDENAGLALARYRSLAGNDQDEDGDVFDDAAALHDGGDSEGQA
jgi:hypothetical protein